jgi:hypothetical protein
MCTVQTTHGITRPPDRPRPSTRTVFDHPQSSATGLLLLARSSYLPVMSHLLDAHYETCKRDSPHETRIKVKLPKYPGFEFKSQHVNDSSHIKPKYSTLFLRLHGKTFMRHFRKHIYDCLVIIL